MIFYQEILCADSVEIGLKDNNKLDKVYEFMFVLLYPRPDYKERPYFTSTPLLPLLLCVAMEKMMVGPGGVASRNPRKWHVE